MFLTAAWLAFGTFAAPQVQAYTWDETTYMTFAAPVEVPGKALPAGTYVFRVADAYPSLDIIQILSPDQTKVYATIQTMPAYRMQPNFNTVITFAERPGNSPEAIESWFYPGTKYGHKFIYPRNGNGHPRPAELKTRP
jgi:hypothetical protein